MKLAFERRLKQFLAGVFLFGIFCFGMPQAQTQELTTQERLAYAQELAERKRFDAALDEIEVLEKTSQSTYEARLFKAKILSWAGSYELAKTEFESLLDETPGNPDVLLAYGYWSYYQGDNKAAEIRFEKILGEYPDYQDARNGLELVQRAERASDHLRLDIGAEISQFSRSENENWSQSFAQITRQRERQSWALRYDRYDRFSLTDDQLGVSHYRKIGNSFDVGASVSGVINADFRPDTSISGVLGWTKKFKGSGLSALRSFGTVQIDSYEDQKIISLNSGMEIYLENGMLISGTLITVKPEDMDRRYGYLARISAPVTEKFDIAVGFANSPETINAVVVRTETIFGSVAYKLSDDLTVRLSVGRDDRENSYIRESLNVGLSRKF